MAQKGFLKRTYRRMLLFKGTYVQRFPKRWALGCWKFLPGLAWLLLSKTGPPFSASLFTSTYLKMRLQTCNHFVETNNSRRCEPLNL